MELIKIALTLLLMAILCGIVAIFVICIEPRKGNWSFFPAATMAIFGGLGIILAAVAAIVLLWR